VLEKAPNKLSDIDDDQDTIPLVSMDDMKSLLIDISHASAPIRSLIIPCTASTIETLSLSSSILPALSELSMDIPDKDMTEGWELCCMDGGEDLREDTWCPELNDEDAFDSLHDETLSDSEEDLPPVCRAGPTQTLSWADPPTVQEMLSGIASLIHSEHSCRVMLTSSL
jgi:hypothetical protein